MRENKNTTIKDALILCAITLVLGLVLAGVYEITKEPIEKAQAQNDKNACEQVISAVEGASIGEGGEELAEKANEYLTLHRLGYSEEEGEVGEEASDSYSKYVQVQSVKEITKDGKKAGYVFLADAKKGYGGKISFVMGEIQGVVTGLEITSQSETAGLGANCEKPAFKDKFSYENGIRYPKDDSLPMYYKAGTAPKDEGGQIEAMSGATVTSKGITNAIKGLLFYAKSLEREVETDE